MGTQVKPLSYFKRNAKRDALRKPKRASFGTRTPNRYDNMPMCERVTLWERTKDKLQAVAMTPHVVRSPAGPGIMRLMASLKRELQLIETSKGWKR